MSEQPDRESLTWQQIAARIEYADLRVDADEEDLKILCLEAVRFLIPVVVVSSQRVALAAGLAHPLGIKVAAVVSYPGGAHIPEWKMLEIEDAISDGADILYMVMAKSSYLDGHVELFTRPEIHGFVANAGGRPTRLVVESGRLADSHKQEIVRLAIANGVSELMICSGCSAEPALAVTDAELLAYLDATGDRLAVGYMGIIEDAGRAFEMFHLGLRRLCTPSAHRILAACPDFPYRNF
jgi:deoxyribose-phosphate aldolase